MDTLTPAHIALVVAIAAACLLLGGLVAALILRSRNPLAAHLETLHRNQAELAGRLGQIGDASLAQSETLRATLDARLTDAQDRSAKALSDLNTRLALIDRAQSTIEALSGEVSGLQSILSDKQARGAFGERQMADLLEGYLPPRSYSFQCKLSNATVVDALIHMPGDALDVAVDSKFPLEAWRALQDPDTVDKTSARRAFARDVTRHVTDIASRYLLLGETHEVALMFLPSESVYAELHAGFPDVVDRAFRQKVMIVSPTTFMATLHTIRAVMRDAAMREQAHIILSETAKMTDDVRRLDTRVARLQSHFDQATEDVRQIRISTDKITRRSDRLEDLEATPDALPENVTPLRPV